MYTGGTTVEFIITDRGKHTNTQGLNEYAAAVLTYFQQEGRADVVKVARELQIPFSDASRICIGLYKSRLLTTEDSNNSNISNNSIGDRLSNFWNKLEGKSVSEEE